MINEIKLFSIDIEILSTTHRLVLGTTHFEMQWQPLSVKFTNT